MAKTAKVGIEFNTNDGVFTRALKAIDAKTKETKGGIDALAHSTQILSGVFASARWGYDKFQALSGNIIKINSDFETLKTSLTGLISASHSNVNSLGRLMGVQEKWALSTKKADDTLQSLNKIASKTSFNLDQTAQMFKSFYSTANSNMSLKQSIEAFEGLANMASVVGINVDQMIRTLDGVGSGKWTSSELTRFLEGSLGLTKEAAQEAIKAGTYYDLLIEKTAEFAKMADATGNTFEAVTEAFKSEVENLTRSLTGEMFNNFKDGIKEATTFLKENKDAIVGAANTAVELAKHLGALGAAYYGARIANLKTGEVVYEKFLSPERIKFLIDKALENDCDILTYQNGDVLTNRDNEYARVEVGLVGAKLIIAENMKEHIKEGAAKVIILKHPDEAQAVKEKLQKELGDEYEVATSKPFFIEINDKGISKGDSLDALCKKLGLTKDNVMALGDGLNDLSMIEFAGMGVAVDNANPVLKEAANFISKSNDEDGFAYAIEKFILNNEN